MSWFDASGFANLAKSALKEAQKTIDKALDIKDEEQKTSQTPPPEMTDFFETWGLKNEAQTEQCSVQEKQQSSIWGSFTGSFFENSRTDNPALTKPMRQSKSLQESFDSKVDDNLDKPCLTKESFSESPFKDTESSRLPTKNLATKLHSASANEEIPSDTTNSDGEKKNTDIKKSDVNQALKRISVISCESDRKNSESVEILGSHPNTDCTTTPESELNSASQSFSLSLPDPKVTSESVEILPDSLVTSPSSVEVLGDSSPFLSPAEQKQFKSSSLDGSDISPYESPMEEARTSIFQCKIDSSVQKENKYTSKISPDSVQLVADVDESDEVSLAEDSYTSASETTVMTILDLAKVKKEFSESSISLDLLKEKHNLHLPLEPITTQPIRKQEYLESVKSSTIEPSEPEVYEETIQGSKIESAEVPDQYLMLTDSSCEGTLIESSSEDNATLIGNADSKVAEAPLTSSSYVKSMLADAMYEKSDTSDTERHCVDVPRENSPISSER